MCENCETLKRNPERSVMGLLMGEIFNEVLAQNVDDLERKFPVMVELATHYCQGSWIRNKPPIEKMKR